MRLKYALASPLATCAVGVTAVTNINHCDQHDGTTEEHLNDVIEEGEYLELAWIVRLPLNMAAVPGTELCVDVFNADEHLLPADA